MALMQISEPGSHVSNTNQKKRAIGIDLGTTNSLVGFRTENETIIIKDDFGNALVPSIVHFPLEGKYLVGKSAEIFRESDPKNTVVSVKRLLGRGAEDVVEQPLSYPYELDLSDERFLKIRTRRGSFSPVEISSEILKHLQNKAQSFLQERIDGVVITVPAYFDEAQRQATKDSATLAGMNVLRLLNEPTAAAIAYGLDNNEEETIAVYDLGGGTFDISILRIVKGVFEVLATGGDASLGGDDFDFAIADWISESLSLKIEKNTNLQANLLSTARIAKEKLSNPSNHDDVNIEFMSNTLTLTRDKFSKLTELLVRRTIKACRRTVKDAGIGFEEIDSVLLVGGSSRNFNVRKEVKKLFGIEPKYDLDPEKVVALGAALQADVLIGNKGANDSLLLDVIPLSLGLETMGGLVEKIIPRNATIPISKSQEFTTFKDGQTAMKLHILQGERELVSDCRSLAHFELRDIPPMVAGSAKISVSFRVDADGLLSVEAQELSSGEKTSISIKPSFGLTEEEITKMLRDSFEKAEIDHEQRLLTESQVEADRLIHDIQVALEQDGENVLDEQEIKRLQLNIKDLQNVRDQSTDRNLLVNLTEKLMKSSETFAERRMNFSIKKALSGKSLDEVETE
ncbi:Fe-S protein assembly chaperone HscA [Gammaproteobacteria bacterium]|nr:Fe-S protein assembly chaperone HscA [Gammaproteobacteria bacterium]